jgi:hypothetical protein
LKNKYSDAEIPTLFENYDITKLDINRLYRYLDKYIKENVTETDDAESDCDICD